MVFAYFGSFFILMLTLPLFPIAPCIVLAVQIFVFRKAMQTKNWKPPALSVLLIFSLLMYANWYLGSGSLIGGFYFALGDTFFKHNYIDATVFMHWFGNVWLIYSGIVGYELFRRGNKPYSLVLKVASLILFAAFLYVFLANSIRISKNAL